MMEKRKELDIDVEADMGEKIKDDEEKILSKM
ncbi:Rop family plasmid primer RNA-binding protein [Klebsiella pneumoniae]|nr:Rop family plasmid primer RNA-binding protein [Klebsiella pneumoniae]